MKNKTYLKILSVVSAAAVVASGTTILSRAAEDVADEIASYEAQAEESISPEIMEVPAPEGLPEASEAEVIISVNEDVPGESAEAAEVIADSEEAEDPAEAADSEAGEPEAGEDMAGSDLSSESEPVSEEAPGVTLEESDSDEADDAESGDEAVMQDAEEGCEAGEDDADARENDIVSGGTEAAEDEKAGSADDILNAEQAQEIPEKAARASSPAELGRDLLAEPIKTVDDEMTEAPAEENASGLEEAAEESAPLNSAGPGSIELVGDTSGTGSSGGHSGSGSNSGNSGNTSAGGNSGSSASGNANSGSSQPSSPAPAVPAAVAPEETSAADSAKSKAPKTGDNTQAAAYALLGLAAVASAAAALGWRDETADS